MYEMIFTLDRSAVTDLGTPYLFVTVSANVRGHYFIASGHGFDCCSFGFSSWLICARACTSVYISTLAWASSPMNLTDLGARTGASNALLSSILSARPGASAIPRPMINSEVSSENSLHRSRRTSGIHSGRTTRSSQGVSQPRGHGLVSSASSSNVGGSSGLDAAALQAHFTRSLNLSLGTKDFTRSRRIRRNTTHTHTTVDERRRAPREEGRRLGGRTGRSNDEHFPETTLAQKMGLVQGPKALTADEWAAAELAHEQREYGEKQGYDCPICCEVLGVQKAIITCCSHVFHLACLQSFEKFVKRSTERTCPICRKQQYQKRPYSRGAAMHRHACACLIQRYLRGYVVKKKYGFKLASFYGTGAGDRERAHEFFANRVGKATDRLVEAMEVKESAVDALFAELDQSMAMSRSIFGGPNELSKSPSRWDNVRETALKRAAEECPICMCNFSTQAHDKKGRKRAKVLLSCSHVFHEKCITTFESFNNDKHGPNTCPVCRAAYSRIQFC